ncbi:hypothetical protein [Desulfovibrio sp. UCD-KL4C]|uniref:hypothetical protein n=1 Tax=Desulfovibrio sp. UCD-KL4C TaxID=2578120 RepID=UPI0025C3080E|nr:hypothetical protein [Desulfovibrio sp. UCD-KL4C]
MKSLMKACVLSMAMLVLMCGIAGAADFNAQGSAIVPHMRSCMTYNPTNSTSTGMYLSNITDKNINCKISVYDQNGNDISSYGYVMTVIPNSTGYQYVASGSQAFDIAAHSSCYFKYSGTFNARTFGYAVVKWNSSDALMTKALVGAVEYSSEMSGGNVYINNGHPF